jgi:hypothetical protein
MIIIIVVFIVARRRHHAGKQQRSDNQPTRQDAGFQSSPTPPGLGIARSLTITEAWAPEDVQYGFDDKHEGPASQDDQDA